MSGKILICRLVTTALTDDCPIPRKHTADENPPIGYFGAAPLSPILTPRPGVSSRAARAWICGGEKPLSSSGDTPRANLIPYYNSQPGWRILRSTSSTRLGDGNSSPPKATLTIPIVMALDDDPIANGFVVSLARPGGILPGSQRFPQR